MLYGGTLKQIGLLAVAAAVIFLTLLLLQTALEWVLGSTPLADDSKGLWQLWYVFSDSNQQTQISGTDTFWFRMLGATVSLLGSVILGGFLISTISNMLERRVEAYRNGLTNYAHRNHVLVVGSDTRALSIVRHVLFQDRSSRVVLLTSSDVDELRRKLLAMLPGKLFKRVTISYGSRNSEQDLREVSIENASKVFVFGEESDARSNGYMRDSLNVECLSLIASSRMPGDYLPVCVAFDNLSTYQIYQHANLPEQLSSRINLKPYNAAELWARTILERHPLDEGQILTRESDRYVHLVIIGMSRLGDALAMETARNAHYPNSRKRKTVITLVDKGMDREMDLFKQKCGELFNLCSWHYHDVDQDREFTGGITERYAHLSEGLQDPDFIDLEWHFIKGSDSSPRVKEIIENAVLDPKALPTIAVCLDKTHHALRSAMSLPGCVYEKGVTVLVSQVETDSMIATLSSSQRYSRLVPFGMEDYEGLESDLDRLIEMGMRVNYVYDFYGSHQRSPEEIDMDRAIELWRKRPESERWSNLYSAASIPVKLRCIGNKESLEKEDVDILSEMEHNRWVVEKLLLGYRPVIRGEKADKRNFIHDCIKPSEYLTQEEAFWDRLIVENIRLIRNI